MCFCYALFLCTTVAQCVDKLQWSKNPAVEAVFQRFREDVLWPHIYKQVRRGEV